MSDKIIVIGNQLSNQHTGYQTATLKVAFKKKKKLAIFVATLG